MLQFEVTDTQGLHPPACDGECHRCGRAGSDGQGVPRARNDAEDVGPVTDAGAEDDLPVVSRHGTRVGDPRGAQGRRTPGTRRACVAQVKPPQRRVLRSTGLGLAGRVLDLSSNANRGLP